MCKFKSGIILKNKIVLAPEGNESHSSLLESIGITDTYENAARKFVRAELTPPDDNITRPVSEWKFNVDQDVLPDWYESDPERYIADFRAEVEEYMKDKIDLIVAGRAWNCIKEENGKKWYLLNGTLKTMNFGKNNNYAESDVRKYLNESNLLEVLKAAYGDRLVPISLDLTAMNGYRGYGKVDGDYLAIPNTQMIMECGEKIQLTNKSYWLSTPSQASTRKDSSFVQCVDSGGGVGYGGCGWCDYGVRPFFILQS